MRLAIQYMDGVYETFEVEDKETFDKSVSAGRGLNIHTKTNPSFSSKHIFIPFTAIKRIVIED